MAEESGKTRLGRGLAALIGDVGEEFVTTSKENSGQKLVPLEFIRPNPRNPRHHFDETELEQLSESIRQRGIIQPLVVRAVSDVPDVYEIVAGERRWRAAQRADLRDVPVIVIDVDEKTSLELAIIENVQRSDLNPIDEAAGYQRLIDEFGYSHSDLAQVLGKSRPYVANAIRLLNLPQPVKDMVIHGDLTAGHARALLAMHNPESVAKRVLEHGLTVRDLERLAQEEQGVPEIQKRRQKSTQGDSDIRTLEHVLESVLHLKVKIVHKEGNGEVRIRYDSLEQLDSFCRHINESAPKP